MRREKKPVQAVPILLFAGSINRGGEKSVMVIAFLFAMLLMAGRGFAAPPVYSITDLGTLGGDWSEARGINDSCQITGESVRADGRRHAFLYSNGKMKDLGSLGANSWGNGINVSGQVAGTTEIAGGTLHAFRAGGSITDLGSLGSLSKGYGINSLGHVTGLTGTSEGQRAFVFNGQMIVLGTLPKGRYSHGYGINDSGIVTGVSENAARDSHAFIFSNGQMIDLGTLPGGYRSQGNAINVYGQVTGYSNVDSEDIHAFLFSNGQMTDLGTTGGYTQSVGLGINNLGFVVGKLSDSVLNDHAFLFDGSTMYDLNSLVPPDSGWELSAANAINSRGQIVGVGTINGARHAFLLTHIHEITASSGPGGSISPPGTTRVVEGKNAVFTITPEPYYHVVSVIVDGVDEGPKLSYTFTNVTDPHTISVTFAKDSHFISASAGPNGSLSPLGRIEVIHGESKSFQIKPDPNYHVLSVVADGLQRGPITSYTFYNVTEDHQIQANFISNKHTILASAGANGTISPSGAVAVNYGETRTFNIKPGPNAVIADVVVDGRTVGVVTEYTFEHIESDHEISATFAPVQFTIDTSAGANGSISPRGPVSVSYGGSKTFKITPAAGYHVVDVIVDKKSVGAVTSYKFDNVTSDHSITATFSANVEYVITATTGSNGFISPSGQVKVGYGADVIFAITPNPNYHVANVLVDNVSVGPVTSYQFTSVKGNHSISATFAKNQPHIINASAGANGTITPSGSISVPYGARRTFTIKPAANYRVEDVRVDEQSIGAVSSYTFTNVIENHSIRATFSKPPPYTIAASTSANGKIAPSGIVKVPWGGSKSFKITPNAGFSLWKIFLDGASVELSNPFVLGNILSNHTLFVRFRKANLPPVVDAGPNQNVTSGAEVYLSAANSTDPDDGILSYLWRQIDGPKVNLDPVSAKTLKFIAPPTGPKGASLSFQVMVTDKSGQKPSGSCIVNVLKPSGKMPPVADAGRDQQVEPGSEVELDGSGSTPSGQDIVTYQWTQISGPAVSIENASEPKAYFTAPNATLGAEPLVFRLTVRYPGGPRWTDTCIVNVGGANIPPTANAGPDLNNIYVGQFVALDGTASTDPEGNIETYRWKQVSGPPVTLANPAAGRTTFTAPGTPCDLVFELTVSDSINQKACRACSVKVTAP